ncbi:MAG TPA: DUF4197 domain-containing protein [Chitinophagaceae bacterium]|nr:DUF4197 domain-containing protein [Chitinophagaceae bacterium]
MKTIKLFILSLSLVQFMSCNTLKSSQGGLTEQEAIDGIKELLSIGSRYGGDALGKSGAFSKESLMSAIFPPELQKLASTLQTLGLSKEVDRFTTTMGKAAEESATKSVPIFVSAISKMSIRDAFAVLKNGQTGATDYLRATVGDTLRRSITPTMNTALDEYKLASQWNKLVAPAQLILGQKVNLDLGNLMAGLVANAMFNKIQEKEIEIRTRAEARTTPLLQKVFSKDWSK